MALGQVKTVGIKFKNFDAYKKIIGETSANSVRSEQLFKDYIVFHQKFRYKDNFFLKEILFECLPYPEIIIFYMGFKESLAARTGIDIKTIDKWLIEFEQVGLLKKVSNIEFKRTSRFDFPE